MKMIVVSIMLFGFVTAASALNSQTEASAKALGASMISEIKFSEGQSALTKEDMDKITSAVNSAKNSGEVKEVRVISWADQEYPVQGASAPKASVKLAEDRADHVKRFLKKDLKVDSMKTFNMAKRPNAIQEFLNTPSAEVKDSMEVGGAAPTTKDDTGLFGLRGKSSVALVLVYMK